MVDDIHFPKSLPSVSATGQVQRVNRKKRDEDKPPFEKYLEPDDKKDKKKKRKKKKPDTVDVAAQTEKGQTQSSTESANSDGDGEPSEDSDQKIIDIRI